MIRHRLNFKICLLSLIFLFVSSNNQALALISQEDTFFVDPTYDDFSRNKIEAQLIKAGEGLIAYADKDWLESLDNGERNSFQSKAEKLDFDFKDEIYPKITSLFGTEWKPGIDGENRIFILFHPLKKDFAGYTREIDEFPKEAYPQSNQKEIIYLNPKILDKTYSKEILVHELLHLIVFNQKIRKFGVSEERWLQEFLAEAGVVYFGYDLSSPDNYFALRVDKFLSQPSDPLLEWTDSKEDYATVHVLSAYIIYQLGPEFLPYILKTSKTGISAIEYALSKVLNFKDKNSFDIIFFNWAVAQVTGDCKVSSAYCYNNEIFKGVKVIPNTIFLPPWGQNKITTLDYTKPYTGKWYRIAGGRDNLKLVFENLGEKPLTLAYILLDKSNGTKVEKISFEAKEKKEFYISDFQVPQKSLIIIPLIFNRENISKAYPFRFSVEPVKENSRGEELLRKELLEKIKELKAQIEDLKKQIAEILTHKKAQDSCFKIFSNLHLGSKGFEVKCLQKFLKKQGSQVYPQGLVTGYFGPLTKMAVIRFQEKYKDEILLPLGLKEGTGFVGPKTRAKINQLLESYKSL